MSSNLNYKQSANVTRRTWDQEEYEARAKARTEAIESGSGAHGGAVSSSSAVGAVVAKIGEKRPLSSLESEEPVPEEFVPAQAGAAGPYKSKRAFLKARRDKVDLESKVGKSEMVSAEAVATTSSSIGDDNEPTVSKTDGVVKMGVGWHCKVCDCFLKDSMTYLDHINGRKHQAKLGYSMRIERSTKEQVSSKLEQLAQEAKETATDNNDPAAAPSFEDVVKAKDEEALRRKAERARKREERKKRLQEEKEEEEQAAEDAIDPDMAAMMGFSGFAGGNKNQ